MITSHPTPPVAVLPDPAAPTAPNAIPALELVGVERSWGSRKVLDGVHLSVPPGTVAWLGGPNGAGKTTLLRVAGGILLPDRGRITLGGLDPERDRRAYHKRLGYLCAGDRGLYSRLTVTHNLDLACRLAQVARRDRADLLESGIERFELGELAARRVDRLSMGQRQRVRLAMAFIHEPTVVLLDEPHTSLDDRGLELVEAAMFECARRGAAVLWCSPATHTPPLASDVRYTMSGGRVLEA